MVPLKGGRWHSPSPNWQEKYHLYTTYIYIAFWGIINGRFFCFRGSNGSMNQASWSGHDIHPGDGFKHLSRQFIVTSAEVTPKGSDCKGILPKMALIQVKDL